MESRNINDAVALGSNHDDSSSEFENHQKHYKEIIAKLPHETGWRQNHPYIQYGGHWWLQSHLEGLLHAQNFFKPQPNDFFLCTYPKTGTTWLKALTFTIANRSNFDDSTNPLLNHNPHNLVPFIEIKTHFLSALEDEERSKLFSTHIPYHLLPESIVRSDCKMVYIWRDPKDTFVSAWTFGSQRRSQQGGFISLEEGFDKFCQGLSLCGPYLDHVLGYWKAYEANPDKILILKYETLRADPLPFVKRLAEFMGYGFTEKEVEERVVEKVVKLCSFENLKSLEVNKGENGGGALYANSAYFRKGEVGDWQNYLTPEMAARIDGLMEEKFKGTSFLSSTC